MDYKQISDIIRLSAIMQGIAPEYIDRNETLYYDESGNIKHLIIKEDGKLNADDTVFVLGGIQAEEGIDQEDLNRFMGKRMDQELKSSKVLKGNFIDLLRKDNFRRILSLVKGRQYHVHFSAVQILYYGFVDIIDSMDCQPLDPYELKACLYDILKKDSKRSVDFFRRYKYPDVAKDKKNEFINGLIKIISESLSQDNLLDNIPKICMLIGLDKAKSQEELPFIQDEEPHEWVKGFGQFYRQEVLRFPNKTLIFDEEVQVQRILEKEEIEVNGNPVSFSFRDSSIEPMIQICDYIVSILRKYMIFLDRPEEEIRADIGNFSEIQLMNFRLLNEVLSCSLDYNPAFFNFVASKYMCRIFYKIMEQYGK